jgi:NADH dehydrogenase FAD-containing subunit
LQLVIPEHIPAFSKKRFISRANIDPRCFVVLGDSETALSAIDALRTNFTGRVIVVPTSPYGSFENVDIFTRKFSPINKNEAFMVEEDYLDRANIDVIKGEIKAIDLNKNQLIIKGTNGPIEFDKILIAWGS